MTTLSRVLRPGPWFAHRLLTALMVGGFLALLIVAAWL